MRDVMIATPSYDGSIEAWYVHSLANTIKQGLANGINFVPIFITSDALIQRARNDLLKIAIEGDFDGMLWIDGDVEWDSSWAVDLFNRDEDVIGGTYPKKTDAEELYAIKISDFNEHENGLLKAEGLGMGFVKVSKAAMHAVWDASPAYENVGGRDSRMAFNIEVIDGSLYSEDMVFFRRLKDAGYDLWVDPKMCLNHIGSKKFIGDFAGYVKRIREYPENM